MKQTDHKQDEHGARYEDMPGERESGDGEGDKKFIIDGEVLSPEELEALNAETNPESS